MPFEVTIDDSDKLIVDDSEKNKLGGGGQGNVYIVEYRGKKYALKWYTADVIINNSDFRKNLKKNASSRSPDPSFVWPQHFAENDQSYGYLMDIIDTDRFTLFSNIYVGRKRIKDPVTGRKKTVDVRFASLKVQIVAAINLVTAFRTLHRAGFAYLDINDGGFYMDVNTGDVLVCDCDNISPSSVENGKLVIGTPGFLAPELVESIGKILPNMETDRHSLAILLFMLLLYGKPFDGKLLSGKMISQENEREFYGKNAVFVFHPTNKSNRPVDTDVNLQSFWPIMPEAVKSIFTECFTDGINRPSKRPTENRWLKALNSLRAGLIDCACGGSEEYLNDSNIKNGKYVCPHCKSKYGTLAFRNGDVYPLKRGKEIYGISIGGEDPSVVLGAVGGKEEKGRILLGLVNSGNKKWVVRSKDEEFDVEPEYGFELKPGMKITFNYEESRNNFNEKISGEGTVQ